MQPTEELEKILNQKGQEWLGSSVRLQGVVFFNISQLCQRTKCIEKINTKCTKYTIVQNNSKSETVQ